MKGLTFSLKRAIGVSGLKTKVARKTGLPTTKLGLERKIGGAIIGLVVGKTTLKTTSRTQSSLWHRKRK